jgi:hypothetical protein
LTVTSKDFTDTWTVASPPAMTYTPSTIKGERKGGFTIDVGEDDKANIPMDKLPAMEPASASGERVKPAKARAGAARKAKRPKPAAAAGR